MILQNHNKSMNKENRNTKQDILIATLVEKVENLERRFNRFVDNEFEHLRVRVDWIIAVVIVGTLLSILVNIIFK